MRDKWSLSTYPQDPGSAHFRVRTMTPPPQILEQFPHWDHWTQTGCDRMELSGTGVAADGTVADHSGRSADIGPSTPVTGYIWLFSIWFETAEQPNGRTTTANNDRVRFQVYDPKRPCEITSTAMIF